MFETILDKEERGQVGIGTLIVFIAMVLVAAIAAGVLINTAGFLQTQAEATSEESTDLVSERIDAGEAVGVVGADDTQLRTIKISVSAAPGADDIDLGSTTLQAVGPNGQANLVFTDQFADDSDATGAFDDNQALNLAPGEFAVLNQNGEALSESAAVLGGQDTYRIVVNPAAEPFGGEGSVSVTADPDNNGVTAFGQSQESTIDIISPASATTQVEIRAPDLFGSSNEAVRL